VVVLAGFWGGEDEARIFRVADGWNDSQGPGALWKTELWVGATGGPASANRSNGCQEKIEIAFHENGKPGSSVSCPTQAMRVCNIVV
jgi:hypothetical protein